MEKYFGFVCVIQWVFFRSFRRKPAGLKRTRSTHSTNSTLSTEMTYTPTSEDMRIWRLQRLLLDKKWYEDYQKPGTASWGEMWCKMEKCKKWHRIRNHTWRLRNFCAVWKVVRARPEKVSWSRKCGHKIYRQNVNSWEHMQKYTWSNEEISWDFNNLKVDFVNETRIDYFSEFQTT